jgi:hypothetical protein
MQAVRDLWGIRVLARLQFTYSHKVSKQSVETINMFSFVAVVELFTFWYNFPSNFICV